MKVHYRYPNPLLLHMTSYPPLSLRAWHVSTALRGAGERRSEGKYGTVGYCCGVSLRRNHGDRQGTACYQGTC